MERVLRLNNTDQRITYSNNWNANSGTGRGQNGTYALATSTNAELYFLFRGTYTVSQPIVPFYFSFSHPHWPLIPLSQLQAQASDFLAV
jgi:hypothetical protein